MNLNKTSMVVEYDGIKIIHDFNESLVEFDTALSGVTTDNQFVIYYAKLQDYMRHKQVRYLVVTKKNNDFELSAGFNKFRQKIFIEHILREGVKQIFYLVSAGKTKKYRKLLPDYVQVVNSHEEINAIIKENRNFEAVNNN
jgi:hypothetical protein